MALPEEFQDASERVKKLAKRPANAELLELYALYKQGTDGDISGKKPGFLDLKGRKKFEAWESKKGLSKESAQKSYVALVKKLETSPAA